MDDNKKEQMSSIFFLLFSVFICFFSYKLSLGSLTYPDSGFFPFYLGIILGLFSIRSLIIAIKQKKIAVETIKTLHTGINWKNIILTVIILFFYPFMLNILGFPVSVFLFTVLFLRLINPQRWWVVFSMGATVTIVFYIIFQYWLKILFPSGIFGI